MITRFVVGKFEQNNVRVDDMGFLFSGDKRLVVMLFPCVCYRMIVLLEGEIVALSVALLSSRWSFAFSYCHRLDTRQVSQHQKKRIVCRVFRCALALTTRTCVCRGLHGDAHMDSLVSWLTCV